MQMRRLFGGIPHPSVTRGHGGGFRRRRGTKPRLRKLACRERACLVRRDERPYIKQLVGLFCLAKLMLAIALCPPETSPRHAAAADAAHLKFPVNAPEQK
jgi:hypothetical protein